MLENLKQLIRWDPPNDKGGGDKPADKPTKTPEQIKKEAKEKAIADIKAAPGEAEVKAEDMVAKAKGNVDKVEGADDKSKTDAKTKLDGAAAEFADIVALLKKRLQLKTDLAKFDPKKEGFDFLHAQDVLKKADADKAALVGAFGEADSVLASVEGKKTEVNAAAKNFYEGLAKINVTGVTEAPDKKVKDYTDLMAQVAKMQEAKHTGFPGVDEATQKSLDADFKTKIAQAVKALSDNQAAFQDLSADDKESFKRLKFAVDNMAAAESDKNSEHMAGADQYMEMVLAEQEARRVWASLPVGATPEDSWRADTITGGVDAGWNKEGANYQNYNAALKAFNDALKLSANREIGDSTKARDLFKTAANKWREVLNVVEKQKEEKQGKEIEIAATGKKTQIEEFLKKTSLDFLPDSAQKAWLEGKTAFDTKNFKEADAKFAIVITEIERVNKGEFNEEDRKAAQTAAENAQKAFEGKYGSHAWAKSVTGQAEGIKNKLNRSGVTPGYATNIYKDVARIYSEAGAAIAAYDRVMAAFKVYQEARGQVVDTTGNMIYQDGVWRFDRGAFVEATAKLNECAALYEAINKGEVDANKSNAMIDGKIQEGKESDAKELQGKMTDLMARSTKMNITDLTRTPLVNAENAMTQGYWARAINQYKQIESMVTAAEEASKVYYMMKPLPGPGTDAYDFIQQGNTYYNAGSFAEAKTYYQNAVKEQKRLHPESVVNS